MAAHSQTHLDDAGDDDDDDDDDPRPCPLGDAADDGAADDGADDDADDDDDTIEFLPLGHPIRSQAPLSPKER